MAAVLDDTSIVSPTAGGLSCPCRSARQSLGCAHVLAITSDTDTALRLLARVSRIDCLSPNSRRYARAIAAFLECDRSALIEQRSKMLECVDPLHDRVVNALLVDFLKPYRQVIQRLEPTPTVSDLSAIECMSPLCRNAPDLSPMFDHLDFPV